MFSLALHHYRSCTSRAVQSQDPVDGKNLVLATKNKELKKRLRESRKSNRFLFNKAYDFETKFSDQTELVRELLTTIDRLNRDATDRNQERTDQDDLVRELLTTIDRLNRDATDRNTVLLAEISCLKAKLDHPAPSAPPHPDEEPPRYTEY